MIFKEQLLAKVLDGSKVVTRRPVKSTTFGVGTPSMDTPQNLLVPCRYKVGGGPGGSYALQGPPEKGSRARARTIPGHRLRVVDVRRETLSALGDADARREGFDNRGDFISYWIGLYGSFDSGRLVDRIEFELVEDAA